MLSLDHKSLRLSDRPLSPPEPLLGLLSRRNMAKLKVTIFLITDFLTPTADTAKGTSFRQESPILLTFPAVKFSTHKKICEASV